MTSEHDKHTGRIMPMDDDIWEFLGYVEHDED